MFRFLLAPLSASTALLKAFGNDELSGIAWKLEGIFEKLQPAIGSWSIKNTWFNWFNQQEVKSVKIHTPEEIPAKELPAKESPVEMLTGYNRRSNTV